MYQQQVSIYNSAVRVFASVPLHGALVLSFLEALARPPMVVRSEPLCLEQDTPQHDKAGSSFSLSPHEPLAEKPLDLVSIDSADIVTSRLEFTAVDYKAKCWNRHVNAVHVVVVVAMAEVKAVDIGGHKIRLLTEDNYNDWLVDIRAILRPRKLWKYATEPYTPTFNPADPKKPTDLEIISAKAEETEWKSKAEETADYMTPTIGTKMKNKLKDEHFNNSYKMLLRIKEELEPIGDAQFMRLTKEYYSLNIKDYKDMSEFLDKVKQLEERIDATKVNLTADKRTIICLMMGLAHDREYRSLIQIWAAMPNLTGEKARAMLMEEYRQQEHVEESIDAARIAKSNNKGSSRSACKDCGRPHSGLCWDIHPESAPDWLKEKKKWEEAQRNKANTLGGKVKKVKSHTLIYTSSDTDGSYTDSNQMGVLTAELASENNGGPSGQEGA
ncbi:hypothetical protein G7Y79_00063g093680 [Physcia stellaris]|nr:hypothetical protein G7Y79_00063g093680 [Physcia stellaris]